jgi:hypothetical protein
MAEPVQFPGGNFVYHAPKGHEDEIQSLPCYRDGNAVLSCWKLDGQELMDVLETGIVWVWVQPPPEGMIPLKVQISDPFVE